MKRLSIVLAVYNEENKLTPCLESVKDIAWEIIIVDGGSTDKTVEIARRFKARVIQTTNPQNFHINKNKAIDAASGDWILQLDADEIVTKELLLEIKNKLNENSEINGYWIPRKNLFLGKFLKKGGQYPDYTLRFYKRGKGRLPGNDVHEQAIVEGRVGHLKNDLLHLRDMNFFIYMERFNRYTDLLSTQITNPNFFDYFFLKPISWFLKAYIRHKGFMDGFPGFVFAFFSACRFPVAFTKYVVDIKRRVR